MEKPIDRQNGGRKDKLNKLPHAKLLRIGKSNNPLMAHHGSFDRITCVFHYYKLNADYEAKFPEIADNKNTRDIKNHKQ